LARAGGAELIFYVLDLARSSSFLAFFHIITEPFISRLCELPAPVKKASAIYLDKDKFELNKYAADRLARCGYNVYWVSGLHTKLFVLPDMVLIGSANWTRRAVDANKETLILLRIRPEYIEGLVDHIDRIRKNATKHAV